MKMRQTLLKGMFAMVFFVLPFMAFAQGTVTGNVTDEENLPLPGVTIIEKGTSNGASSDFDGNYEITISSFPATLQFSYLGYATKEMEVTGPTTLNVALEPLFPQKNL